VSIFQNTSSAIHDFSKEIVWNDLQSKVLTLLQFTGICLEERQNHYLLCHLNSSEVEIRRYGFSAVNYLMPDVWEWVQ